MSQHKDTHFSEVHVDHESNEKHSPAAFKVGEEIDYYPSGKSQQATIIKIEYDDGFKPLYVIELDDETQRTTDERSISKVASSSNQTRGSTLKENRKQLSFEDSPPNTTNLSERILNSNEAIEISEPKNNCTTKAKHQSPILDDTPDLKPSSAYDITTTTPSNPSINENKREQGKEESETSTYEWKEGDHVKYSNDDDLKSTREATVIRVDKDSIFGTFFAIKFHDNEDQRIALPKQLHPLGIDIKQISKEKEQRGRDLVLKKFSTDKGDDLSSTIDKPNFVAKKDCSHSNNSDIILSPHDNCKAPTYDDRYNPTYKQEDCMSEGKMESAMIAHQKNKEKLWNQTKEVEQNKLLTNRERIQAAMRNLGQPVSSTSIQKSTRNSRINPEDRSSDMVQRYAVFANLDSDDDMTTGEESEMTEHVRNSHRSSSLSYMNVKTNNQSKNMSIFSRLRKSKHNILKRNRAKLNSKNNYHTLELDDNDENNINKEIKITSQNNYSGTPLATTLIHALTKKPRKWNQPTGGKIYNKFKATVVTDMPSKFCRRSSFPYFKSQNNRNSKKRVSCLNPIMAQEIAQQDGEGIPVAVIASDISNITMDQESFREDFAQERTNISYLSGFSTVTDKETCNTSYCQKKYIIITLAIICAIALSSMSLLIILQNLEVNTKKHDETDEYEPTSLDDRILPMPKMYSESFIQAFYGVGLSPMTPTQVTIWENIMEDYASELVSKNEKKENVSVSSSCVINYQLHEGSVTWNRNRKRKHDQNKEVQDFNSLNVNNRRKRRNLYFHETSQSVMIKSVSSKNADDDSSHQYLNMIKIDFTMNYSTILNDVDLLDYPSLFLERMNSNEFKEGIMTQLQGRLRMAVEEIGDISLRNENGAALFSRTFPTLNPTTLSPSPEPSTKYSISPSHHPTLSPSVSHSSFPTSDPSFHPTARAQTSNPTQNPTWNPTFLLYRPPPVQNIDLIHEDDCCWFFCLLAC